MHSNLNKEYFCCYFAAENFYYLLQVWEASTSLVKIFQEDMENLWEDLDEYMEAFSEQYEDLLELLHLYLAETKTCLKVRSTV